MTEDYRCQNEESESGTMAQPERKRHKKAPVTAGTATRAPASEMHMRTQILYLKRQGGVKHGGVERPYRAQKRLYHPPE